MKMAALGASLAHLGLGAAARGVAGPRHARGGTQEGGGGPRRHLPALLPGELRGGFEEGAGCSAWRWASPHTTEGALDREHVVAGGRAT